MSDNSPHWYVLRAAFHSELKVRDSLRQAGLRAYVPLLYRVETQRGHKIRRLVAAITELVFVHSTQEEISAAKVKLHEKCYWLSRPVLGKERREKVIVNDRDMDNFMRVTEQMESEILYFRPDEVCLAKGDHIRIHGGTLDGVEGVLLKVKGRREKQLVVSIPDLAVAAVTINPDIVEVVSQQRAASCNVLGDAKELIRLSARLLMSPPDKDVFRHEWNLLHREVQGLYQSLLPRKGYIATTEAQLSLSLLLAERALDMVTDTTVLRCRAAVSRLRPSKLRDQLLNEIKKTTL